MPQQIDTAFVLGGGGAWGAYEVGMLRALLEAGIEPDIILGTSVGAINGSAFAADPGLGCVGRPGEVWTRLDPGGVFWGSPRRTVGTPLCPFPFTR